MKRSLGLLPAEMRGIDTPEFFHFSSSSCFSTRLRVAEVNQVKIANTLFFKPRSETALREPLLARHRNGPDIHKLLHPHFLQRFDEPINIGALIADREKYAHSAGLHYVDAGILFSAEASHHEDAAR